MKIYGTLLAISAFHPTAAFIAQVPSKGWKTANALPSFSYREYVGSLKSSDLTTSGYTDVNVSASKVNGEVLEKTTKSEIKTTKSEISPSFDASYTVR